MGSGFINQCAECHHLKTLKPIAVEVTQLTLQCSFCNKRATYRLPEGWNWVSGPPVKGDERGAWIVRVDFLESEDMVDMM